MSSAETATPLRAAAPTFAVDRRSRHLSRLIGIPITHIETVGMAILLFASFFPASPPTAASFSDPSYVNLWSLRLGPANVFELAMAAFALAWVVRRLVGPGRPTGFDRPLGVLVVCLLALQALALPSILSDSIYIKADLERIALAGAGYLIVTRCIRDMRSLRLFTYTLAGLICIRAAQLVIVYGITGETQFSTILGRSALLITEDGLLLMLPVALAWGAVVDGRLTLWRSTLAVLGTAIVFVVNLLSLRRGAVLMIAAAVIARSLGIGARRLLITGAAILVLFGISVAAGPGRPLFEQVKYTATSSVLSTKDPSSSQRLAELENLRRNLSGSEWLTGRGIGVFWRAEVPSPVDIASFGSKETAYTRLGWHVYGLDWLYKFGLVGVALILGFAILLGRRIYLTCRKADGQARWLLFSLAVCAPPFLLLAFTNPRIALVSGMVVGLLSRGCDFARSRPTGAATVA